jgi:FKBP-type peptidyl-prolyl cis-trans isomerase
MNRSRILAACFGAVLLFARPSIGTSAAPAVPPDPSIRSITDALDTEQIRYRVVGDRQELVQVSYKTDSYRDIDGDQSITFLISVRKVDDHDWVELTSYNLYSLSDCSNPHAARRVLAGAPEKAGVVTMFSYDETDGTVTERLCVPMPESGMSGTLIHSLIREMMRSVDRIDGVLRRAMDSGMIDWPADDLGPKEPTGSIELKDKEGNPVEIGWAPWIEKTVFASTLVAADPFLRDFCKMDDQQREALGRSLAADYSGSVGRATFRNWLEGAQYVEQHYPLTAFRFFGPAGTEVSASVSAPGLIRGTAQDTRRIDAMGYVDVEPMPGWNVEALLKLENPSDFKISFEVSCGNQSQSGAANVRVQPVGIAETGLPTALPVAIYVNELHPWARDLVTEAGNMRVAESMGYVPGTTYADAVRQVYAVWRAFRARDLKYVSIHQSNEAQHSQAIRQLHEAVTEAGANCADGSAAFASVLQALGFDTHLCHVPGHVFVGAFLPEESGESHWIFVETTMLGEDAPATELDHFEDVRKSLPKNMLDAEWNSFEAACQRGSEEVREARQASNLAVASMKVLREKGLKSLPVSRNSLGRIAPVPAQAPIQARRESAQRGRAARQAAIRNHFDELPQNDAVPYKKVSDIAADIEHVGTDPLAMGRLLRAVDGDDYGLHAMRALGGFRDALVDFRSALDSAFGSPDPASGALLQLPASGGRVESIALSGDKDLWSLKVLDADGDAVMHFGVHPATGGYLIDGSFMRSQYEELVQEATAAGALFDVSVFADPKILRAAAADCIRRVKAKEFKTREDAKDALYTALRESHGFDLDAAAAAGAAPQSETRSAAPQRASAPAPGDAPAAVDGLKVDELKRGNGPRAVAGDVVSVHYSCRLEDGTVIFDSKRVDGKPRRFTAGGNVRPQGLGRALVGAQAGATRIATIPPELAYGSAGLPASNIPPNAVIVYEFEVVEIRAKK